MATGEDEAELVVLDGLIVQLGFADDTASQAVGHLAEGSIEPGPAA